MPTTPKAVLTLSDFTQLIESTDKIVLVSFWAKWADAQCEQMNGAIAELRKDSVVDSAVTFATVEAESLPDAALRAKVTSVPTIVIYKKGTIVDRIEGANVPELTKKLRAHVDTNVAATQQLPIEEKLKQLINKEPVMLFMKGSPNQPRCGFSRTIVDILKSYKVKFGHFDILQDDEVRQKLKEFSNWPTYPQLYASGELLGGLDIVKEMVESGELLDNLPIEKDNLTERLKALINRSKVMLFMKGSPDQPRCGFSRTICSILKDRNVTFDHFDILTDEDVRQGLKEFSNWPTYPQLYANGELVGGLDIIKEMIENDEFDEAISS
ncbi:DgyrCDS6312 [Dimorphilus gyrociliatus]|uniref:DgyrCDS6312 n=1 Tax=Dimorphilus gyrociliatus TaxID=2664684 RepID=A0A7I8VSG9_9ANNE|nr:DgyrCDS6312 [Dimorphilus gyrociliatus]